MGRVVGCPWGIIDAAVCMVSQLRLSHWRFFPHERERVRVYQQPHDIPANLGTCGAVWKSYRATRTASQYRML